MKIYAAWTSLTVYETRKWKQITHAQKFIYRWQYPQGGDCYHK